MGTFYALGYVYPQLLPHSRNVAAGRSGPWVAAVSHKERWTRRRAAGRSVAPSQPPAAGTRAIWYRGTTRPTCDCRPSDGAIPGNIRECSTPPGHYRRTWIQRRKAARARIVTRFPAEHGNGVTVERRRDLGPENSAALSVEDSGRPGAARVLAAGHAGPSIVP